MKKLLILLFALILCFGFAACSPSEQTQETEQEQQDLSSTQLPNPMTQFETFEELVAAVPDITLFDAPNGSAQLEYFSIDADSMIAEIRFAFIEDYYYLRATACESKEAIQDISGIYEERGESKTFTTPIGVEYSIVSAGDFTIIDWYIDEYKTQYNMTVQTEGDGETLLSETMRLVLADYQ